MDKPSTAPPDNASRNQFYILAISAVAALGGFLFGFDSGVITWSPRTGRKLVAPCSRD